MVIGTLWPNRGEYQPSNGSSPPECAVQVSPAGSSTTAEPVGHSSRPVGAVQLDGHLRPEMPGDPYVGRRIQPVLDPQHAVIQYGGPPVSDR